MILSHQNLSIVRPNILGSAVFDPLNIDWLINSNWTTTKWQDTGAVTEATANTDPVQRWQNQGTGDDWLIGTSAPQLLTGAQNGYAAVRFNDTVDNNEGLTIATSPFSASANALTVVIAARVRTIQTNRNLFNFGNGTISPVTSAQRVDIGGRTSNLIRGEALANGTDYYHDIRHANNTTDFRVYSLCWEYKWGTMFRIGGGGSFDRNDGVPYLGYEPDRCGMQLDLSGMCDLCQMGNSTNEARADVLGIWAIESNLWDTRELISMENWVLSELALDWSNEALGGSF